MTVVTITQDVAAGKSVDTYQTMLDAFLAPDALNVPSKNGFAYSNVAAANIELFFSSDGDITEDDSDPNKEVITGGTVQQWDIRDFSEGLTFLQIFDGYKGELKALDVYEAVLKLNADPTDTTWLDVFGQFDYDMGPSAGNTIFRGFGGDDTMAGGAGSDTFDDRFGGDKDMFNGGSGRDLARVGGGDSTLAGGAGNDTLSFGLLGQGAPDGVTFSMKTGVYTSDAAIGASGTARSFEFIVGSRSNDKFLGNAADNSIMANLGDDQVGGGRGDDLLLGAQGNDALNGNDGADTLTGGLGHDTMAGGAGADVFDYNAAGESKAGPAVRDVIFGFGADDQIDISGVDADSVQNGNQDFAFIGDGEFTKVAGQLAFKDVGGDTLIAADRDGNGIADFHILLRGDIALNAGDFVL